MLIGNHTLEHTLPYTPHAFALTLNAALQRTQDQKDTNKDA